MASSRVSPQFRQLLAERKLMKANISKGMIQKELQAGVEKNKHYYEAAWKQNKPRP